MKLKQTKTTFGDAMWAGESIRSTQDDYDNFIEGEDQSDSNDLNDDSNNTSMTDDCSNNTSSTDTCDNKSDEEPNITAPSASNQCAHEIPMRQSNGARKPTSHYGSPMPWRSLSK